MKLTVPELRALAETTGVHLEPGLCKSAIVAKLRAALPKIVTFAGQAPYQFKTHDSVLMFLTALSTASDPDAQKAGRRALIELTDKPHPVNILAQFQLPRINDPEVVAAHRRRFPHLPNHYRADALKILIEIQGAQCLDVLLAAREDRYLGKLVLPYLGRWAHRRPIYRALHETLLASRRALVWLLRRRGRPMRCSRVASSARAPK